MAVDEMNKAEQRKVRKKHGRGNERIKYAFLNIRKRYSLMNDHFANADIGRMEKGLFAMMTEEF